MRDGCRCRPPSRCLPTLIRAKATALRIVRNTSVDSCRNCQTVHAPALIDAEVSSVIRGFAFTTKPNVRLSEARALEMLDDYAGLRIVRHAMQPLQGRVFELRHNFTAYDAMYIALAEVLGMPLLTDDRKFDGAPGHRAEIHRYPADGPAADR